ncbi:peptidase MA family metallohydrolase [Synoicihabitans lomoniglobus]|uniref:Peptidase MA family metallohydrolase n=1 Tax=Synoicihabitans lomoniglobus TaxID=2909285 RepID=A0AAF0I4W7_9BACT|nr:hypothetical protein [Opitutaceae bacterium LMO-M01]WED67048.1 peptidase MA family metallohydrolase [Opitutaceae bacterium LMO-M01]
MRLLSRLLFWVCCTGLAGCLTSPLLAQTASTADYDQAWNMYRQGGYDEALAITAVGRLVDEANEDWWRLEGEILFTLGRYHEAYNLLGEGITINPDSLWLMLQRREVGHYVASSIIEAPLSQSDIVRAINMAAAYRGSAAMQDSDFLAAVSHGAILAGVEPKVVLDNFLRPAQENPDPSRDAFLVAGQLALDKQDAALASRTFRAGLEHYPDDPDLEAGLAAAFQNTDTTQFLQHTGQALAINPRHIPSQLLLAQHFIDAEDEAAAEAALDQILGLNPRHPEAHALRAAMATIADNPEMASIHRDLALANWSDNPRVDFLIGQKLSRKYRFAEAAAAQRRALVLDPLYQPSRIQLAQDLLRLGREDEGWALAAMVHAEDGYNIEAFNLTTLHDRIEGFTTVENAHFRIRMAAEEAAVYGQRALALLEDARTRLSARYGIELEERTTVEIYPDPADFAVRTFGMPGIGGYLGVCFGSVFTVNSPTSSQANWEAVLWHEFTHVITLTLTRNRMPRWLSEGISVYEELERSPGWGQRMSVDYHDRIVNGRMQSLGRMSAAFLEARTGEDTMFAYYQSYLVVEFLAEHYGFAPIRALLRDLAAGMPINDSLETHFAALSELEPAFVNFARARADALAPDYDLALPQQEQSGMIAQIMGSSPRLPFAPDNIPQLLRAQQTKLDQEKWADVRDALEPIAAAGVYLPQPFNVHALLATAYAGLGEKDQERETLETIVHHEAGAVSAITKLLRIAREDQDWAAVARWSDAWLAVNPMAATPWRARYSSHRELGDTAIAIAAGETLLRLDPPDRAAIHFGVAELLHQNADLDAARRHTLQALEEAPRFRAAYDLLATLPSTSSQP